MNELNEKLIQLFYVYKNKLPKKDFTYPNIYIWIDTRGVNYNISDGINPNQVFSTLEEVENYINSFRSNKILYRKFSLEE